MQKKSWKLIAAAVFIAAVIVVTVPRESLQGLLDGLKASVGGASYGELMVVLTDPSGSSTTFVHKISISREDANRLKSMPQDIPRSDLVVEAKKKLAEKQGFHQSLYGSDSYRVMAGIRLERVELKEASTGRTETLYGRTLAGAGAANGYLD
jgi:hypothetical protein